MYCTQCGTENSDQSRFCRQCGHRLQAQQAHSAVAVTDVPGAGATRGRRNADMDDVGRLLDAAFEL